MGLERGKVFVSAFACSVFPLTLFLSHGFWRAVQVILIFAAPQSSSGFLLLWLLSRYFSALDLSQLEFVGVLFCFVFAVYSALHSLEVYSLILWNAWPMLLQIVPSFRSSGTKDTSFHCTMLIHLADVVWLCFLLSFFFYKLKIYSNSASSKSVRATPPYACAHCVSPWANYHSILNVFIIDPLVAVICDHWATVWLP